MSKLTRRFKNNIKNKTLKRGGAFEERIGVVELLGDNIKKAASFAATNIADASLKIAGLERINKSNQENQIDDSGYINEQTGDQQTSDQQTSDEGPGILCTALDIVDKTGGLIINDINDVLSSDRFKQTTEDAAKQTGELIKQTSKTINDTLNDPAIRAELEEAIKKAGEISDLVIKYGEKPYNRALDVAAKAAQKVSSAAVTGTIKVGTDALAAVPLLGSVVSVGNMVNNTSKAACAITEAGTEMVEAASDAFIEIKKNVDKNLGQLEEQKKMADQISNRINNSINDFENPRMAQTGGNKTRRRLFKRNARSKRVRFFI
jgi:hypothetical protein